jgi:hypothetical protein
MRADAKQAWAVVPDVIVAVCHALQVNKGPRIAIALLRDFNSPPRKASPNGCNTQHCRVTIQKVKAIKDVMLDYMNVSTDQLASALEKS